MKNKMTLEDLRMFKAMTEDHIDSVTGLIRHNEKLRARALVLREALRRLVSIDHGVRPFADDFEFALQALKDED